MKANELMIGDWCYIEDAEQETVLAPIKVVCIAEDNTEWLHPIPLTEDILTMNGLDPTIYCNLSMPRWFMGIRKGNKYIGMSFEYVHELQHALRLCGLNDMADNFKIK